MSGVGSVASFSASPYDVRPPKPDIDHRDWQVRVGPTTYMMHCRAPNGLASKPVVRLLQDLLSNLLPYSAVRPR